MPKKKLLMMILPESPLAEELRSLLSEDYEIIFTSDEESGLRALLRLRDQICAVLLDLETAQKSDFSFFREVNSNVLYAAIPIVAILSQTPTANDMTCLDMGAADVFSPPFEGKLLRKRLSNVIRAKDSATFYEIERMLKVLPSNIYLKDAEGKYIFATHYWHHLDKSDDPDWTIRGKTDPEIRKDKENARLAYESDKKILASGQGTQYIIEINVDNKHEFLELIKEPIRDEDGKITGIVGLINDVTEHQLLKLELEKRSKTDELTGLPNRRSFHEYIPTVCKQDNFPIALISADCNNLKIINDTYGHLVGDEYLRMSALLFRMTLPKSAAIFRIGGDEFIMILPKTTEAKTLSFIQKMRKKEALFKIREHPLSIAFGHAMIHSISDDINACLEAADQDMYNDKNRIKKARK